MKHLPIGTIGVAAYDIECLNHTIKKGSRVTVTGFDNHYGYWLVDENGNMVVEAGFDCVIPMKNVSQKGSV